MSPGRLRTFVALFLACGVLCGSAWAMDKASNVDRAKEAIAPIEKAYEEAYAKHREELTALRGTEEYQKALEEGREKRDFTKVREMTNKVTKPFTEEWRGRFEKAGEKFEGTEGELVFASALLGNRLAADHSGLLKASVESHIKSEHLELLAGQFRGLGRGMDREAAVALFQRIIDENPVKVTKANAYYSRAMMFSGRGASEEDKAKADKDLEQVVALMPQDSLLSLRARGPKFKRDRLQIGMEAPDIEGTDIDGVAFKLSDYRGKVVMLDFWGDW